MTDEEERNRLHAAERKAVKAARDEMMESKTRTGGLLMVHTGEGKGKSTAAFGMVARALGWGMQVGVVQFIKGKWITGERRFFARFPDQIRFESRVARRATNCSNESDYALRSSSPTVENPDKR